jgi:hypothetical protein
MTLRAPIRLHKKTRRAFLIGAGGVCVGLPLLESLHFPLRARAGGVGTTFALFVRAGNGVQQAWDTEPERFWPRTPGPISTASLMGTDADRATSELAAHAASLSMLRGVDRPFGTPACGHSESIVQCLTGAQSTGGTSNDPLALGESADWRIARELTPGQDPMVLMAGPVGAYIDASLSWSAARMRASAARDPAAVYMDMMGISSEDPLARLVASRRMSTNDLVRSEFEALLRSPDLSGWDRRRLEAHRDAIRDTEVGVLSCDTLATTWAGEVAALGDPEQNDVRPEVARRFMDVMALAVACGYVRAGSLQVGEGNDQTQYRLIDGTLLPRFHWISHRIESDGADGTPIPNADMLHHEVDRIQLRLFKHLLDRLASYETPTGTTLNDGVTVWLNDLGNGPPHGGRNVPWLLAGSCGGRLRTGNFVDLTDVQINRVLVTILQAVGCTDGGAPVASFGDSGLTQGPITELLV